MSIAPFVDSQNVPSLVSKAELFVNFAKSKGNFIPIKIYYNSRCPDQLNAKTKFQSLGCQCIDVPCNLKNSADNRIVADIVEVIEKYPHVNKIVLVSGDGDFEFIVRLAKKQGKKVVIFGQRGNVKQIMIEIADEFYYIDELPELVKNSSPNAMTQQPCKLPFEQAMELLISVIHTAKVKGKPARQALLADWMFKHPNFPPGKKASSIYNPDGKPFSDFSSFAKAVLKTGKVQKNNDEFFVVESLKQAA